MGRLLIAVLALVMGACGGSEETAATTTTATAPEGCGIAVPELLDPASSQHVFPNAPEPAYLSDPPTSGPHRQVGSERDHPLPLDRPLQVGYLERGDVIIQADEAAVVDRIGRAVPDAVVFHTADLPAPIVATAWLHKMLCEGPDLEVLRAFVSEFRGKGAAGH